MTGRALGSQQHYPLQTGDRVCSCKSQMFSKVRQARQTSQYVWVCGLTAPVTRHGVHYLLLQCTSCFVSSPRGLKGRLHSVLTLCMLLLPVPACALLPQRLAAR